MSDLKAHYRLPKGFVFILAMLTSISPLAIDVYLPSFIQMSQFYGASIGSIELTLSIYLLGFALGQLIGGPLSDRFGRKKFIIGGVSVYILFSFLIAVSDSLEALWVFRFIQAIGGGFAVVNTNAIVRDLYHGKKGAKVFSIISMIMMLAPMLAPAIGTLILYYFSWQFIFFFLGLYALLLLYFILKLPETSPYLEDRDYFGSYLKILKNSRAVLIIFAGGFGFSGMFVFITKSSFIYMEYFGLGSELFTFLFALNVLTLIGFSRANITVLNYFSPLQILLGGVTLQFGIGVLLSLFHGDLPLWGVVVCIMLYIGALGFIFANAISLLLEHFSTMSATANALFGVFGFLLSSLLGLIASFVYHETLLPIFLLMCGSSFLSLVILRILIHLDTTKKKY